MVQKKQYIRNFAIVAHIDHGKSTLADRLIQFCGGVYRFRDEMDAEQILDNMDIERERGITIKAQTVRLKYRAHDGHDYILNLLDTPGHVDFSYEVSRSLSACEGTLLVVDAVQGVEAQTLANAYLAIEANHEILPVLNKVDLPASNVDAVKEHIENLIGVDTSHSVCVSAKTGEGIEDLLESIIEVLPPPQDFPDAQGCLSALLVDGWYDSYAGVIVIVGVKSGVLKVGMNIMFMSSGHSYDIKEVGYFLPKRVPAEALYEGDIGYFIANIKDAGDCVVGDTVTEYRKPCPHPLPGFKSPVCVVFCGLFPTDPSDFVRLKQALVKLALNDKSFSFEMASSAALGFGYHCGFLGLLHLEVIQERLMREFDLDLISTAPSVIYHITLTDGSEIKLNNPSDFPEPHSIVCIKEPWVRGTIFVPEAYVGSVITLCTERRGVQVELSYLGSRILLLYDLPLSEIVFDFYDRLKSVTKGYASFDYEPAGSYQEAPLVKLSFLVNGDPVDALSLIVHEDKAVKKGREMCERLKDLIPRQMFKIAIQASIGAKIVAREDISALRKDVTAKCYGGDITRKRKLLERQKEGKKRMRQVGKVDIPQSAFLAALKGSSDD